jgi:hypothetical protein
MKNGFRCEEAILRANSSLERAGFLCGDESGAEGRTRTGDLLITNQLLYQLSYFGLLFRLYRCNGGR